MTRLLTILLVSLTLLACTPQDNAKRQSALALSEFLLDEEQFNMMVDVIAQKSEFSFDEEHEARSAMGMELPEGCMVVAKNTFSDYIRGAVSYDDTVNNTADFYYDNFTHSEINKFNEFYRTPVGQEIMKQANLFMKTKTFDFGSIMQNVNLFQALVDFSSSGLAQKSMRLLPKQLEHTVSYLNEALVGTDSRAKLESLMASTLGNAMRRANCGIKKKELI